MKLSDFIRIVKYGELSTLQRGNDYEAITAFVNMGLLALYVKFPLRSEEFLIELQDGQSIYDLPEDFMYMTGAYETADEDSDTTVVTLPINEEGNLYSVNTVNYRQVQIPLSVSGAYVGIIYVARPELLTPDEPTEEDAGIDAEIPLPEQLIEALINYVASKAHGGIVVDGQATQAATYYRRFERLCDEYDLRGVGIAADDLEMPERKFLRGFP